MPGPDLAEQIRGLSPGALTIFKRQLASLPQADRERAFSRLSNIPELADIIGRPTPIRDIAPAQKQPVQPRPQEIAPWQRGLQAVGAPFQWIGKHITEPFGAYVTSPFTPAIAGTEGMGWAERERAEYAGWQEPTMTMPWGGKFRPTKGILETLPWLALPSAAGVLGKAGMVGAKGTGLLGLAQKGGALGRGAELAAKVVKPIAAVEQFPMTLLKKGLGAAGIGRLAIAAKQAKKGAPEVTLPSSVTEALKGKTINDITIKKIRDTWWASIEKEGYPTGFPLAGMQEKARVKAYVANIFKLIQETEKVAPTGKVTKLTLEAEELLAKIETGGAVTSTLTSNLERIAFENGITVAPGASPQSVIAALKARKVGVEAPIISKKVTPVTPEVTPEEIQWRFPTADDFYFWARKNNLSEQQSNQLWNKAQEAKKILQGRKPAPVTPEVIPEPLPAGASPPIEPPIKPPPTATGAAPEPEDVFSMLQKALYGKTAKTRDALIKAEIKASKAATRARVEKRLEGIEAGQELTERVWREEAQQQYKRTPVGLMQSQIDEHYKHIRSILKPQGVIEDEIKGTQDAFAKWAESGHISRTPGIKGGSAETRLMRVYGEKVIKAMEEIGKKGLGEKGFPSATLLPPGAVAPEIDLTQLRPLFDLAGVTPEEVAARVKGLGEKFAQKGKYEAGVEAEKVGFHARATAILDTAETQKASKQLLLLPEAKRDQMIKGLKLLSDNSLDALNIFRATLSSGDFSYLLRQGAALAFRHPVAALESFGKAALTIFSPEYAKDVEQMILNKKSVQYFISRAPKETYLAPLPEKITALLVKEESFMSNIAMKIPILGHFIRASARNFVTGLNMLRAHAMDDAYNGWIRQLERTGIMVDDTTVKQMSRLIAVSTGRGDLKALVWDLNKYGGLLNTVLFSPRLFISRFQWPAMIASSSREVRIEAWKQIGSFVAAGGTIASAIKVGLGGEIELDPRSADFGKVKLGDTRLDLWTGYAQYLRFVAQITTMQRKTEGGFIQPLNRRDVASRLLESKLSPAIGLFNDILKGQSFAGEEFPAKTPAGLLTQLKERAAPLAIQDMIDGFVQSGVEGGLLASMSLFGAGVTTYTDEAKRARDKAAQRQDFNNDGKPDGMTWDEVGLKYGRATQLKLEQATPAILEAEKEQEKRYATGQPTVMGQWQELGQTTEDDYRAAINLAAKKFREPGTKWTGDGVAFKDSVNAASKTRRDRYASRTNQEKYSAIVDFYSQPLTPEQKAKMNPGDVLRREYQQDMFGPDMTIDGEYWFDEADRREQAFVVKYGQQALDYIEEYSGAKWADKPIELKMFEQAKETLRPYWDITDRVWAMYPAGLQEISKRIDIAERANPGSEKVMLRRYPQILRARELIARYRKQMRDTNPAIKQAHAIFYG